MLYIWRHWSWRNHRVTEKFCNCSENRTIGLQTHLKQSDCIKARNHMLLEVEVIPYCNLLWVPDIQSKCFSYSEKQNNWETITGQRFRRGQKFHLTPVCRLDIRPDRVEPTARSTFAIQITHLTKFTLLLLVRIWCYTVCGIITSPHHMGLG